MAIDAKERTEGAVPTGAPKKTGGAVLRGEEIKIDGPAGEKSKIKDCKEL
jgi:hypothetical protein